MNWATTFFCGSARPINRATTLFRQSQSVAMNNRLYHTVPGHQMRADRWWPCECLPTWCIEARRCRVDRTARWSVDSSLCPGGAGSEGLACCWLGLSVSVKTARLMLMSYRRIVAKFGTSLLTSGGDHLDLQVMSSLVEQIARLHGQGKEIVIISSGAIASGRQKLKRVPERKNTPFKQVLASVGQGYLMHTYEQLFGQYDITVAQALLTKEDLCDRSGYLNARNTLLTLMELDIICIANENDVVAIDEIKELKFGDNDNLSAMVANLVDADLLVVLTDIGGLHTADPRYHPQAQLIRRVDRIDVEIERMAGNVAGRQGTGGMKTKIEAARLATSCGVNVVIANGREPDVLVRISQGEDTGTFFPTQVNKMESKKRWMLSGLASKGMITVDRGAVSALRTQNKSLLPAGVTGANGKFQRGDIVDILDEQGKRIGYGIANYGSSDLAVIEGKHSDEIIGLLGYDHGDEVIHRNNMVLV
jgi:glutamate 5-kinase